MSITNTIRFWSLFDNLNCIILDIKFGEGGTDSKLFVHDLASMYLNYAKLKNIQSELMFTNDGQITIQFSGQNVWKHFKQEIGKHTIQRIPPTENNGRRHTSNVMVSVLPLSKQTKNSINQKDITLTTKTGSGPGGQHRNKTECAVRLVHNPTGICVTIDGRSQSENKIKAFEILNARVTEYYNSKQNESYNATKKNQIGNSNRGGGIRTYNFIKGYITDHNTGKQSNEIKKIMKGHLEYVTG